MSQPTGVFAALARGAHRSVEVILAPAEYAPCADCDGKGEVLVGSPARRGIDFSGERPPEQPEQPEPVACRCSMCDGRGLSDVELSPAVALRFRVRKLDSELLARQGTAILFTDLPADLSVLAGDALKHDAAAGSPLEDTQRKIKTLRRLGPKFFESQARNADAIVCAGVVALWQEWGGPSDERNPAPPASKRSAAIDDLGYWRAAEFTRGTPDVDRGRFPLTALSKGARAHLAKEISEFSLDDGGIADAIRTF